MIIIYFLQLYETTLSLICFRYMTFGTEGFID